MGALHIAKKPVPPGERLESIPAPVSPIIMKLLAKTLEDRYQTACGLKRDPLRCLAEREARRCIDDFPLGPQDTPNKLVISEKLYGRDREIVTLLSCFDRIIKTGVPELVLVSGYSGVGKSSVVDELHTVQPRGLFASRKFVVEARYPYHWCRLFKVSSGLSSAKATPSWQVPGGYSCYFIRPSGRLPSAQPLRIRDPRGRKLTRH